jgi:hypothetical protein
VTAVDNGVVGAYKIRICDVFSVAWRKTKETKPKDPKQVDNTEGFQEFVTRQQDFPETLEQKVFPKGTELSIIPRTNGSKITLSGFDRIEVVLSALPIPVSQVVASLVIDFHDDEFTSDRDGRIRRLVTASANGELYVDGRKLADIVDDLAKKVKAEPEPDVDEPGDTPSLSMLGLGPGTLRERHTLVFVQPTGEVSPEAWQHEAPEIERIARTIIHGAYWPYRAEFSTIYVPGALYEVDGALAVVSHYASVLYGQPDVVHSSVLLSTVQTVGTAARFQWIWRSAYSKVRDFQMNKQQQQTGRQTRDSLAPLADEMGNLELDLTFNVQTAADLGLSSTPALVDSFHAALHEAMKFKTRAETVANMFERVNSSIQSELTAIASREKQDEDDRRQRSELLLGLVTFVLAPLGLLLAFFGISTKDVTSSDSIREYHHYWPVYAVAGALMVIPLAFFIVLRRRFRRRAG